MYRGKFFQREREREREMGEGDDQMIPFLDFSKLESMKLEQGSEEWKAMSRKVREACEVHGCFLLAYDKIPTKLREDMFMAMKSLFDLPKDTKNKYISPKLFNSYSSEHPMVLRESFGIDDAQLLDAAQAFTNLMWPEGNPNFCDVLNSMSSKMQDVFSTILRMIFESYGIGKYYDLYMKNNDSLLRVMKYKAPQNDDSTISLPCHTDKNTLTILCQDEVQGLEILSKDGNWIQLMIPKGCFLVIVGDALKAWSNGRLHALRHKVVMSGDKERYSCGLFTLPKEGATVEVPQELVDSDHPLLYRSFAFTDYFSYFISNSSDDALEIYAGV